MKTIQNPSPAEKAAQIEAMLKRFEAFLDVIETEGFFDLSIALQTYFLQQRKPLPAVINGTKKLHLLESNSSFKVRRMGEDYEIAPLNYLYTLECIPRAMDVLNLTKKRILSRKGSSRTQWRSNSRAERIEKSGTHPDLAFDIKHLSRSLAHRVCRLYQADYCCLGLPMSPECDGFVLDCSTRGAPLAMRSGGLLYLKKLQVTSPAENTSFFVS